MRRHFVVPSLALSVVLAASAALRADDTSESAKPAPAQDGAVFETSLTFEQALAHAKEEGKPLLVDFSTAWCGWCRRLENETFRDPGVAKLLEGFVNLRIDAEKGDGPQLARRFGVRGFPTLVIVGPDGLEIDRVLGFVPPEVFQDEIRRIQSGDGTLASLRKSFEDAPSDVDAGMAYGAKLQMSRPEEAAALYAKMAKDSEDADPSVRARIQLEHAVSLLNSGHREEAAVAAERLVEEYPDTPAAGRAAQRVGRAFLALNDVPRALAFVDRTRAIAKGAADRAAVEDLAVSVHRAAIASSLRRQAEIAGDDANLLNEVAWTSFEHKVNVRDAIHWARKAVDLSDRDAAVLDTLANLLWLVGEHDEALRLEEEAVRKAQGSLKDEFEINVAKWKAELDTFRRIEEGREREPQPEEPPAAPPPIDGTR